MRRSLHAFLLTRWKVASSNSLKSCCFKTCIDDSVSDGAPTESSSTSLSRDSTDESDLVSWGRGGASHLTWPFSRAQLL